MPINFQSQLASFTLKDKTAIKNWMKTVVSNEKKKLGVVSYVFCSDDDLLKVNQDYLQHNTYTDIITFDYSENEVISGDIFISIDRVKENAEKFQASFNQELQRVMIHGILHLCGYKDKTKTQAQLMRQKENEALSLVSF